MSFRIASSQPNIPTTAFLVVLSYHRCWKLLREHVNKFGREPFADREAQLKCRVTNKIEHINITIPFI